MRPRFTADYRTLLWVLLAPALVALQFSRPDLIVFLWPVSCYFALACGVIAHNHNHCPTFAGKRLNAALANWISIFYGYPTFAWIPTHNLNHHKHLNRAGDATITWRHTNRHNLLVAATYFFVSSFHQAGPIREFLGKARRDNRKLYRRIVFQYVFWLGGHASLLLLALAMHGPAAGVYVWFFSLALPAAFALWTIMLFNYEQHVHTDPWSEYDHSRNFTGPVLNFLLFNNGLHAAHHETPGVHWSRLPTLHRKIADRIHPELKQRNAAWFLLRQFALAPFFPSLGTHQIGRAPFDPPSGRPPDLRTAEVELGDAGTNAEIA